LEDDLEILRGLHRSSNQLIDYANATPNPNESTTSTIVQHYENLDHKGWTIDNECEYIENYTQWGVVSDGGTDNDK